MNVHLHIERLVLEGIALTPVERRSLAGAAQVELGRLLATGGVSDQVAAGFAIPAMDGGTIRQPASSSFDSVAFGQELARAVYRGLGRPGE